MPDKFLTIKEVAGLIGVTPLTLRNWDKRGVLRAYRNPANNYRLYRYSEVADFIAEIQKTPQARPSVQRLSVRLDEEPAPYVPEESGTELFAPETVSLPIANDESEPIAEDHTV